MQEKLVLCVKPIFFLVVSGRVKIHGVGDLRIKNDKDGAPVAAGKRHLKLFPI